MRVGVERPHHDVVEVAGQLPRPISRPSPRWAVQWRRSSIACSMARGVSCRSGAGRRRSAARRAPRRASRRRTAASPARRESVRGWRSRASSPASSVSSAPVPRRLWSSLQMPKSSSFGTPSGVHQDVAGLEIAMHDEIAVGVLHRRADIQKQTQPRRRCPRSRARRYSVIREPVDVLHHDVGQPVARWCRRRAAARCWDAAGAPESAARGGSAARMKSVSMPGRTSLMATSAWYCSSSRSAR